MRKNEQGKMQKSRPAIRQDFWNAELSNIGVKYTGGHLHAAARKFL